MRHKQKELKVERRKLNVLGVATFFAFTFSLSTAIAQTMYVQESRGTRTAYPLSNIQKMSFSSGNLTVTKTDNSTGVYALGGLNYLSFTDFTVNIEEPLPVQNQELRAYPCPASNVLNIYLSGIGQGEGTLSILNIDGKTVLTRQVSNEGVLSLDISHLPQGIYLCRYASTTEIKTVKIIKK